MQLSKVLRRIGDMLVFRCPGCECEHVIPIDAPERPSWTWNGSVDKPTFEPSILCNYHSPGISSCHSYVTDGRIKFLSDSTHHLSGKTVDLPPLNAVDDAPEPAPPAPKELGRHWRDGYLL